MITRLRQLGLAFVVGLIMAWPAGATQVRNVVELKGSEQSKLEGIGLVVGLNGTGDPKFGPAHRMLLNAIQKTVDATATPLDLSDSTNIAIVAVRAVVPSEGVRSGVDLLDVSVTATNGASSLEGGVLMNTAMFGPGLEPLDYAVASGHIMLEDEDQPVSAKIVDGAQMTRDIPSNNLDRFNRLTLVLHESKASWELANYIATAINGVMVLSVDADPIAFAKDQKNVVVQVPDEALPNLSEFITQIMVTTIDSEIASGGARVIINRTEGTIAMTKDVELSPVIISHKGMTIQIVTPEPEPDENNPRVENTNFAVLDPENRGGPRLRQLLDALNTLNVPAEDRIAIIKEIHDLGVLHAELIYK